MKQPYLLDVEKRNPHLKAIRRVLVKAAKEKYNIWTHKASHGAYGDRGWLALCLPQCHDRLKGYTLTKEELECPVMLIAGYCRLLEEAGLMHEGYKTELEAVDAAVKFANEMRVTPARET